MSAPARILALEIRASRFGFAVLEGPDRLLDWGVRFFGEQREQFESTVSDRISSLVSFYNPIAIVMRDRKCNSAVQRKRISMVTAAIKTTSRQGSQRFRVLVAARVQHYFALKGKSTKYEIASSLADRFEELSFKLPNRRKTYQSEAPAMLVFDALATGVVFLGDEVS